MDYEIVIGLEVHAQLATKTKIFCSCSTEFGAEPNKNTCPICTGMPGVLPVLNKKVVEYSLKTALSTNCAISPYNIFARKNYFYPDLPKGYQISQYDLPIAVDGYVDITVGNEKKRIRITRIHMEEDAGKLIHGENIGDRDASYVDLNRTGIPLIEIVSEPDIRSPEEAKEYLQKLKSILEYLEVCNCNMEEGSFRCDANVSLRKKGSTILGTKTELKNMNSFKNVVKALDYEIERQSDLLDEGETIKQETRLWDDEKNITMPMRTKEEAHDYRYFPEPDLTPLTIDDKWINNIKKSLPELPDAKKDRFLSSYNIPKYDAQVLTDSKPLSIFFEECIKFYNKPKIISNWIMGDILKELKKDNRSIIDCPVKPSDFTDMLVMVDKGIINGKIAKTVFEEMYKNEKKPEEIVKEKGLIQMSDESKLEEIVEKIVLENQENVKRYQAGAEKLFGFFVGQVMKSTKGKANPQIVNKLLKEKLCTN